MKKSEFNAQNLANTVNAFGKMEHRSPVLFEEVAKAALCVIRKGEFNAQNLANTVNAFGKMSHRSPVLFEEVAKAAIPVIKKANSMPRMWATQ